MEALFASPFVIGGVGVVLAIVIVLIIIVKRYHVAEPDEAIIVTGRRGKPVKNEDGSTSTDLSGQKVVTGGGVFVFPFVQKSFKMSLRSRKIRIETTAQTTNGITIRAQAVAMVKVGGTEEMIRAAAQRFLSQQNEIESYTQDVLSGSLRGIIGSLTVDKIIRERAALASEVLSAAEDALTKQGLIVDTLQIQEITDNDNYIDNLGRPEAARVRQAAEIADTNAGQASQEATIASEQVILGRNRELKLRQAAVQEETDKALAVASAAKPIEDAVQQQRIIEQQQLAAKQQAELKEQQLNAEVRKVADAEAYRTTVIATANATARVAEANAERESRINKSEAVAAEGKAEAEAIEAKGKAEATAIQARADAFAHQSSAVLAQQAIEMMPEMAHEFATVYTGIDKLTVISSDGGGKALTDDVAGNMTSMMQVVKDTTGIDIQGIINAGTTGRALGTGLERESIEVAVPRVARKRSTSTEGSEAQQS